MHVGKLVVKGYRSLADVEVNFNPGINVVVGKNNAGKSNIIRALNSIFGEKHPSYSKFENRDFYSDGSNSVDRIIIAARLDGELNADVQSNKKTKVQDVSSVFSSSWDESCINLLKDDSSFNYKFVSEIISEIKNSSEVWIFLHSEKDEEDISNEFGLVYKFNGNWHRVPYLTNKLRNLLVTTTYVPSYRDPLKTLRITEYSWYGKLVKNIYDNKTVSQETEINQLQEQICEKVGEVFSGATSELRKRLKNAVFHHDISFKPGPYTKDDDYKSMTLFIDDGLDAPFYDKGSGIQSALIIALFTYYCECFHQGSSMLLLEEPENYLHPQGRRALEGEFLRFIKESEDGERQIILSTHSTEFLRSIDLKSLIRIHKKLGSTETETRQIKEDEMDGVTKRKFKQVMMQKGVEMFFADGVILVEGGEEYILPSLFDIFAKRDRWLDSWNISVVRVDGKKSFKNYVKVLEELGIWWVILTDLDFLYDGVRDLNLLETDEENIVSAVASEIDSYLEVELEGMESSEKKKMRKIKKTEKLKSILGQDGDVEELLESLKEKDVFILMKGELEDYFTDETMQLEESKDRRALELTLNLNELEGESQLTEWFIDVSEFENLFDIVKTKVGE